jgi:hypothetical protein
MRLSGETTWYFYRNCNATRRVSNPVGFNAEEAELAARYARAVDREV